MSGGGRREGPWALVERLCGGVCWLLCIVVLGPGVALSVGQKFLSETCPEGKRVLLREALYQGHVIHCVRHL